MRSYSLALVLLLAGLAPLGGGFAQMQTGDASVDLSLPTLAAPVSPSEPQNTSVTVRYQWRDGTSQDNVTIDLSYEDGPEWLDSAFTPSTVEIDVSNSASGVETRIVNLTLDVSPEALAYEEGEATYRAQASSSGMLPAAEASEQLGLQAGFDGQLLAELPGGNVTAWGGLLQEVPIELENTANGPIEVDVRVDRIPADARSTPPETITLGREEGNRSTTAILELRVPWSLSVEGPVEIVLEAQHAEEGTELNEQRLGFQLEGKSAVPIPGPGPWAALVATGVALLLARSRSNRFT